MHSLFAQLALTRAINLRAEALTYPPESYYRKVILNRARVWRELAFA